MKKRNYRLAAMIMAATTALSMVPTPAMAASKPASVSVKVNTKQYTISRKAGVVRENAKVIVKAKKGYKIYYAVNKAKLSTKKVIQSGKKKSFTIKKATKLKVYAVKSAKKVTAQALKKAKTKGYKYTIKKVAKPNDKQKPDVTNPAEPSDSDDGKVITDDPANEPTDNNQEDKGNTSDSKTDSSDNNQSGTSDNQEETDPNAEKTDCEINGHVFPYGANPNSSDVYHYCPRCGLRENHTYKIEKSVEPTMSTQGYTIYKCTVCGHEKKGDYVNYQDVHQLTEAEVADSLAWMKENYPDGTEMDCGTFAGIFQIRTFSNYAHTKNMLYAKTDIHATNPVTHVNDGQELHDYLKVGDFIEWSYPDGNELAGKSHMIVVTQITNDGIMFADGGHGLSGDYRGAVKWDQYMPISSAGTTKAYQSLDGLMQQEEYQAFAGSYY